MSLPSCWDVFVCRTCLGQNCTVEKKLEFKRGEDILEEVEKFYLDDMVVVVVEHLRQRAQELVVRETVVKLVNRMLADVFLDRVGIVVKIEDDYSKQSVMVWSYHPSRHQLLNT